MSLPPSARCAWLHVGRGIGVLPLRYNDVVADPAGAAQRMAAFVPGAFNPISAAAAIDARLRRFGSTAPMSVKD